MTSLNNTVCVLDRALFGLVSKYLHTEGITNDISLVIDNVYRPVAVIPTATNIIETMMMRGDRFTF